nr:DUF805 domain-containing protein [uncultured Caldimonas sp.]
MNWHLHALKHCFDFSGRARRKEYWYFLLVWVFVCVVLQFVLNVLEVLSDPAGSGWLEGLQLVLGMFSLVYFMAAFIASISVAVRRLHDTGRSGWWWLITLVPLLGLLIFLLFVCEDSERGANRYGPSPKYQL